MALHSRGQAVVVLDRACFPRDKICGDLIPPRTFELLLEAGFEAAWHRALTPSRLLACGSAVFDRLASQRPQAWTAAGAGWLSREPIALALARRRFDALLVDQLVGAGVVLRQGWQLLDVEPAIGAEGWLLRGRRRDKGGHWVAWELPCRWLLAADGAGSPIRRRLLGSGAQQPMGIGLRVLAPDDDPESPSLLAYPGTPALLYRWSFRIGAQRNQGLFWPLDAGAARLPAARLARQWFGHCGQAWACPLLPPPHQLIGSPAPGVLLLGDAASLIDPLLGHGIDHAADSGLLAAACVADADAGDSVETRSRCYDERLKARGVERWTPLQQAIRRQHST